MKYETLTENLKAAGCTYRWNYSVVKLSQQKVRTCCQVATNENISNVDMDRLGTEVFLNTDYLVERKLEMLQGKKHTDCGPCWKLEKAGINSMRNGSQKFNDYMEIDSLSKFKKSTFTDVDLRELSKVNIPTMLEIQLDNICDLSCVYCNEEYSTTWAKKVNSIKAKPRAEENEKFQSLFWSWYEEICHNLNGVCIIGGEPLASPNFPKVLDKLKEIHFSKRDKIFRQQFLSITSNFNAKPERFKSFLEQARELNKFFNISINASCEAVGEGAEIIREGLSWDRFEVNIREMLKFLNERNRKKNENRMDFSFHAAQNALSLTALPMFLKWAEALENEFDTPINIIQNIVSYPARFSIQSILSKDFTKYCDEAIQIIEKHKNQNHAYVDNATWQLYAKFILSIKEGLLNREPDPVAIEGLKGWYIGLDDEGKSKFTRSFSEVSEKIIGT